MLSSVLRSLRGSNLEVLKVCRSRVASPPLRLTNISPLQFGMYLAFPIGWMYYFGTNLENRFAVPDFWPTQEQSHKIPFERDEIKAEVLRINQTVRERQNNRLAEAKEQFRDGGRILEEDRPSDGG
jgi:protein PET100, fungi type